jgi:SAM-dependent methyltransferase
MANALRPAVDEALAEWARRVRANREQVERFQEAPASEDFYAPVASQFKADPHRADEPALDYLRSLCQPERTWLDIGGGAGRYALPLALVSHKVTVVEPSDGMLGMLREGMSEFGISNVDAIQSRWPMTGAPTADVALISHVAYDIEEIGPFLDAMEASAQHLCVAILLAEAPASIAAPFWPAVHGQPRALLPALPEFLALQLARSRLFEARLFERPPSVYETAEAPLPFLRQQLWVREGSEKDEKLRSELLRLQQKVEGGYSHRPGPIPLGVITWKPR